MMTLDNGDSPPSGEGWLLLAAQHHLDRRTMAWAEIRRFGGKLWGRIRMSEADPAVFIAAIEDKKPWDNSLLGASRG